MARRLVYGFWSSSSSSTTPSHSNQLYSRSRLWIFCLYNPENIYWYFDSVIIERMIAIAIKPRSLGDFSLSNRILLIRRTCVGRQIDALLPAVWVDGTMAKKKGAKQGEHVAPAFSTNQINLLSPKSDTPASAFGISFWSRIRLPLSDEVWRTKGKDFSCTWQLLEKGALR